MSQELFLRPLRGSEPLTKFVKAIVETNPQFNFQSFRVDTSILAGHVNVQGGLPAAWEAAIASVRQILDERSYCQCTRIWRAPKATS